MQSDQATSCKEMHEEMIGVLTAISIVSKRLATRITDLHTPRSKKVNEGKRNDKDRTATR